MNAANEIAVQAFLDRRIGFRVIDQLIARVMDGLPSGELTDIASVFEQDRRARDLANSYIR